MSKMRVHELAKEIGKQNKEVMDFLKVKGVEVKSHMSSIEEPYVDMVKEKFQKSGKEQIKKLDTPKTEEKVTTAATEAEKAEAPKKKKNIIRVFHAQNASDGGKNRRRPPAGERTAPAGAQGQHPAQTKPAEHRTPEVKASSVPDTQAQTAQSGIARAAAQSGTSSAAAQSGSSNAAAQSGTSGAAADRPLGSTQAPQRTERPQAERGSYDSRGARSGEHYPQNRPARQGEYNRPAQGDSRGPRYGQGDGSRPAQGDNRGPRYGQGDGSRPARQGEYNRSARPGDGSRPAQGDNRGPRYGQGDGSRPARQGEYNRSARPGDGSRPAQGDSRGPRYGQGRPPQGTGQNRFSRPGDGSRPAQGDNRGPRYGQGRPQGGPGGGNRFGGPGRSSDGRSDNRFGGPGRPGQSAGQRKPASGEAGFTSELTKTSKDSKRERDRENKNKKKEFDKAPSSGNRPNQGGNRPNQGGNRPNQGGNRPNQGGRRPNSRIPRALQKIVPAQKQEEKKPEVKEITLPEKMTIRELADAMKMQPSVIVKKLFLQGIMVTVNHEVDFEKAQEIALEYDIVAEPEVKVDVIEELLKEEEENETDMTSRPPVVCVMGHVDHGKTSLLDAIRKTNVTRGEAGGITQHIGAYVVAANGQKITFLDTPGHEAFTAMRMRGANATDIAVLVVAADDGVMPQTVEAISHAKAAGVDIIVAINKIDKPSANVERVKQELSEYELIPEDWGGSTVFVPVSAHTGEGIESLLEMILLTAEVGELKANADRSARGLVIEAQLDKGKGPVATILVQKGTLHVGDFIAAGACSGKVRAMMDDKGHRVKEAGPSTPVEILGLGDVPNAGEILMSFESDKEAKNFAGAFVSENKNRLLDDTKAKLSLDNLFDQIQASDLKELPIVVKADVQGSVEAVKQSLTKLSNEEVVVKIIHGGVGAINESDVSLAATSNAIIIGFNVRPDTTAKQLAEQEGVDLRLYKVIYQAIEDVEAAMKGMLDPVFEEKVIGHAEIRQLFKASGVGTIAGSYVLDGMFQRNCKVRVTRADEQIFEGELASLKRFKDDVKEVKAGYECGFVFENFNEVKEEDKVEAYIMVEVPR